MALWSSLIRDREVTETREASVFRLGGDRTGDRSKVFNFYKVV